MIAPSQDLPKFYSYITVTLLPELVKAASKKEYTKKIAEIRSTIAGDAEFRKDLYATLSIIQSALRKTKIDGLPVDQLETQRSIIVLLVKKLYPNPCAHILDRFPKLRFVLRNPKNKDGSWVMPTKLYVDPNSGGILYLGSRPFEGACLQCFVNLAENQGKDILIVSAMSLEELFDKNGNPVKFQANKIISAETMLPANVERSSYSYYDHSPLIQPETGQSIELENLYAQISLICDTVRKGKRVWLHCWSGIERSNMLAILACCILTGGKLLEVSALIHQRRPITKTFAAYKTASQKLLIDALSYLLMLRTSSTR